MTAARSCGLLICFVVLALSTNATAETGSTLSRLPLRDRCAIAVLIAKEVREVVEISPQGAAGLDPEKLRILISQTADGQEPVSIFRNHETCGDVSLPLTWTKGAKIGVELGVGDPRKLDPVAYVVVSVRPRTSSGWELVWPLDRGYVGCEKVTNPRRPKICLGLNLPTAGAWGHLPALRMRIKRRGSGQPERHEFQVDEAVLEIVRAA